jgi:hypothetical protein
VSFEFFLIVSGPDFYLQGEYMRFLLTVFILSALVACGKNGGGGSASSVPQRDQCQVDGHVVSCDSIYDGLGVDILDAQVDVPATVSDSAITFNQARTSDQQGRRIGCKVSVNAGDVYRYTVNGNILYLDTPTGNMQMKLVHGEGGVVGTWKWTGIVDGATFQTRVLTVLKARNRVIMKTTCER